MQNFVLTIDTGFSSKRSLYIPLFIIFILAFSVRIAVALKLDPEPIWPDGERYNTIADSILLNGKYPVQESHSAPLLPLVLAGIYKLTDSNGTVTRILFAFLGILSCGITYLLGKSLFGKKGGILASLTLAIYPFHVYLSSIYEYPQTLFIFLVCPAVYLLISSLQTTDSWFRLISSGILFGMAVLTVPTLTTALPFLAIWILIGYRQTRSKRVLNAVLFTTSCSLVVFLWSLYAYAGTGKFKLSSGAGAETLFKGNCSLAWQIGKGDIADRYEIEGVPPEQREAYDEYRSVMQEARQFPAGAERDAVYKYAVKHFFIEKPKEAGLLFLRKAMLYWCPYAMTVTKSEHNNNLTKIIQIVSFTPIFILALVGIYLQKSKAYLLTPIYIIIISQWITYSMFIINARYRAQIDVFLIILATPVMIAIIETFRRIIILNREYKIKMPQGIN